jgi:PAS domain S-box-containing protein
MANSTRSRTVYLDSPSTLVLVCVVATLSYLAPKLEGALISNPQTVWPLWPGGAILVSGLLLVPLRVWPILIPVAFAGFVLYDLQVGVPVSSIAWFMLADTVQVIIAALGLRYCFDGVPRLNSVKALAKYSFFAVILAPLAAAFLSGRGIQADYWNGWRICLFSEVLAFVTVTPAMLSWVSEGRAWVRKSHAYHLEAAALLAGLVLLGYITFTASGKSSSPALLYSLVPFLLWSALRFGAMGISTSVVVVAFLSIWGAVHGRGPFTEQGPLSSMLPLQLFLVFAATPFMILAAVVEERKHAEEALRTSEERFRLAAQAGKMFAYEWDAATDVIVRSAESSRILGVDEAAHTTGQQILAKVHPDDRDRLLGAVAALSPEKPHLQSSYRMVHTDSSVIWVERNSRAQFDEQGRLLRIVGMVADITKRKLAEERLQEYEKAVEGSEEMIAVVDREYRYLIANRRFLSLRNMTEEQVVGRLVHEVLNKGVFEASVKEKLDECFRGRVVRYEMKYMYPELGERDIFISYFPIEGATGIDRVACILQDITERKRTEEALRKSEERFRLAAQAGKMYAYEWDVANDVVMRSEESVSVLGFSDPTKQLTRRQLLATVHPDDRALFIGSVDQLTPENPTIQVSYRVLRPDGSVVWLEKSVRAFFDEQGKMLRTIGMVADITERKRVEEALSQSEARLRLAAQAGKMYAYEWDVATDVTVRSEEYANILGLTSAPTGETHHQFSSRVHPDDRAKFNAAVASLTPENPTTQISYRALRPDGAVIWLEKSGRAFFDSQGRMLRMIGIVADITERKRAEEALRKSEEKLRLLLDSTAEAIYGMDVEGRCTFCNPACLRALGYESADELVGKNMHHLIHHSREDGTLFPVEECRIFRAVQSGEGTHVDDEVLWRANGTSFPAEYWSYPQRRGQEVVGAVVAFIDITQRRLAEEALASVSRRLIEAQEQERTRIARELHDDIGQRLAVLAVELEQLQQNFPDLSPKVRSRMGELQKQTSDVATDIQSLSHKLHSSKLQYLGIAAAMRAFCKEFGEQQNVEIDFQTHDLPRPLSPDISLCLFRVLQEALHNSAKHSGVRNFEVRLWGTSGEIHLTIGDSGAGFDSEAAKESRGLGLISMEERLKLLKGTFSIESQPKRGTTIHARVPLSSGSDSMRATG